MTKKELVAITEDKQQVQFVEWVNNIVANFGTPYLVHEDDLKYDISNDIPAGWLLDFCQARQDILNSVPFYSTYCKARRLILDAADAMDINIERLLTTYGETAVVDTRRVIWLMLNELGLTQIQVAAITTGDRTSVVHGVKKVQEYVKHNDMNILVILNALKPVMDKHGISIKVGVKV